MMCEKIIKIILINIIIGQSNAYWQLYWQDNFHTNDLSKWVATNETDFCPG